MRLLRLILLLSSVVCAIGLLFWLGRIPDRPGNTASRPATSPATQGDRPLRLGLIPERDIYAQRRMYRALADYIALKLNRRVELVTASAYGGILRDFSDHNVDAAFLGSLVAVLASDRLGAEVIAKPELPGGISTYRGVIFVPANSPITRVQDLLGRKVAMVRTTTGGNLFPLHEMMRLNMLDRPDSPHLVWVGTHDDAIRELMGGTVDAAAVKDLRLDDFERTHPSVKFKRLASSGPVPENALVLRREVAADLGPRLSRILLAMPDDADGRATLKAFGAVRFLPCDIRQYKVIFDIVDELGPSWKQIGVSGDPPRRPADLPREGGR